MQTGDSIRFLPLILILKEETPPALQQHKASVGGENSSGQVQVLYLDYKW